MELKSAILCLSFALLAITGTQAWRARAKYQREAYPGKCGINDTLVLSPGEKVKHPYHCSTIACTDTDGWATHIGCGDIEAPPNCEWDSYVDEDAPFPICCLQTVKCDDPADYPYAQTMQERIKEMFSNQTDSNLKPNLQEQEN